MDSQSDPKTQESLDRQQKVRVVEDELGHHVLADTIKTIKLTLMNTGIFFMSEEQRRMMKLAEAGSDDADEDLKFIDESGEFDPYDTTK